MERAALATRAAVARRLATATSDRRPLGPGGNHAARSRRPHSARSNREPKLALRYLSVALQLCPRELTRTPTVAVVVNNYRRSSKKPPKVLTHLGRSSALTHIHRSSTVLDPHFLPNNASPADRNGVQRAAKRNLLRTPIARDRQSRTKLASCDSPDLGYAVRLQRLFQ